MRLAIAEDFVNLVILNRDNEDIELRQLLENKNEYYNYILKEFLKKNSSSVVDELKSMDEPIIQLKRKVRASGDLRVDGGVEECFSVVKGKDATRKSSGEIVELLKFR
jgi:hypothetical protein